MRLGAVGPPMATRCPLSRLRRRVQSAGLGQPIEQPVEIQQAGIRPPSFDHALHASVVHRPRTPEPPAQPLLSAHIVVREHGKRPRPLSSTYSAVQRPTPCNSSRACCINNGEGAPQTAVPVLLAPPPEQTPTNVDSSRIDVGRVLVPVDFKDGCVAEVRAAASLAETFDAPLLLVHVVTPVKGIERLRPHLETHNRVQIERADQQIRQLASEVRAAVGIETVVTVGSPAEEIAQIAVARGVGLIVMGLRRQEHMFGPRPGSIAYRVLGLAPARVLALPPGDAHAEWLTATSVVETLVRQSPSRRLSW